MKNFITVPRGPVFDIFFPPENVRLAKQLGPCVWNESEKQLSVEEIVKTIGDCDTYVTLWGSPRLDTEILNAAPNLKLLIHLAGTVKPFVSDAMWERGIKVISGNAYFALSVAEGTVGYMLAALRDYPMYSQRMKQERNWKTTFDRTEGLYGKTVGLVSYGAIARNMVRLLAPFGVKIKVYDVAPLPPADVEAYGLQAADLEEIFSTCDVISLHTPLFDKTYHLITGPLLERIKPGALFVNTSRGAVVDQAALEAQLATGRFKAVLDVYEKEPLVAESPLYDMPNVMLFPHMAGPTTDLKPQITKTLLLEAAAYLGKGQPLVNEITREKAVTMSGK